MTHFNYPFGFSVSTGHTGVVPSDTLDDVVNCVQAILATELGFRPDKPNFGIPDQVFELQPLNLEDLIQIVENQEPRAQILMTQVTDTVDNLIDRISASVALRKATNG